MEVCGGHTHTIYNHGIEDHLPQTVTLVHGPGCPVCVIPMGPVVDGADAALAALRAHPLGTGAAVIGRVCEDLPGLVLLTTAFGGTRVVDVLVGDPLPRIC